MQPVKAGQIVRTYSAVIERCSETGLLVGHVPGFPGAHSQGATLDELQANLQEVIAIAAGGRRAEPGERFRRPAADRCSGLNVGSTPVLKPAEVVGILRKLGFEPVRQRGSHLQFRDACGRGTAASSDRQGHRHDHGGIPWLPLNLAAAHSPGGTALEAYRMALDHQVGIGDAERLQVGDGVGSALVFLDDVVHLQGPLVRGLLSNSRAPQHSQRPRAHR